jgi:hypothetical protein
LTGAGEAAAGEPAAATPAALAYWGATIGHGAWAVLAAA